MTPVVEPPPVVQTVQSAPFDMTIIHDLTANVDEAKLKCDEATKDINDYKEQRLKLFSLNPTLRSFNPTRRN